MPASPTRRPRPGRGGWTTPRLRSGRLLLVVAALALLCAGLLVGAWLALPDLAERVALARLRESGVAHAALDVEELSLHRAVLRSVALGDPPALAIERVLLEYTPLELLAGRLDRLEVSDATLRVVFTPAGPSLGALDALFPGARAGEDGPAAAPPLSVRSASLRRARVLARVRDREVARLAIDAEIRPERTARDPAETDVDPTALAGVSDWLAALRAEVTARLDSDDLAWGGAPGLAARGDLALQWSEGAGTLRTEDLRIALRPGREGEAGEGVDGDGAPWLVATVALEADLAQEADAITVRPRDCAGVSLERLVSGRVSLASPIALCAVTGASGAGATLPLSADAAAGPAFDLVLSSDETLRLDLPAQGDAPSASLRAPRLSVRGRRVDGGLEAKLELRSGRTHLPAWRLAAETLTLETAFAPPDAKPTLSGRLTAQQVAVGTPGEPALLPFALGGGFALEDGRLRFHAEGREPRGLTLIGDGHHDLAASSGVATLELAPLRFAEDALAPAQVFPALSGWVDRAGGSISAKARLRWPSQGVGRLEVALDDLDLASETLRVEGIEGVVKLADVWPPSTEPGQFITFDRLESGLSLTQGAVAFALAPDGSLDIAAAEGLWAGGWLRAKGRIDPGAERQEYALELKGIGLGPLSALTELEGLDATGRLTGTIPIYIEGKNVIIENARLEAGGDGGTIRYRPERAPAALSAAGEGGAFALEALRDFRYETLSVQVAGDADEALVVELHLTGRNPEVSPQPIHLNLTVRGPLGSLGKDSLVGIWFPQRLIPVLQGLRQARSR